MKSIKKISKSAVLILLAVIIAAGIEALLSNYRYFDYHKQSGTPFVPDRSIDCIRENNDVNDSVALYAGMKVNCISFDIFAPEAESGKLYNIDISLSYPGDEDNYHSLVKDKIGISKTPSSHRYYIKQTIDAYAVKITVEKADGLIYISSAVINPEYNPSFNIIRAILIFTALSILYITLKYKLYSIVYNSRNRRHKLFAAAISALCALITLASGIFILNTSTDETAYPLEKSVESCNPYIQQFDAFMKGQLNIDADPPEELKSLENPYDKGQREGIHCLWDRAYYNGKYYSYFGTGPLISLYLPYFIVRGALPSDRFATTFFATIIALFMSKTLFAWADIFRKKIPLLFLGFADVSMIFSSMLFLEMRGVEAFYYIALLSSAAFLSVFAFTLIKAFSVENNLKRKLLFLISGASFGLAFLSRINTALTLGIIAAVVAVINFVISFKNKTVFQRNTLDLICLGLPVLVSVVFAGIFNYLRFGNPLDFGTDYQLTVSDTSQNTLFAGGLAASLYYYFGERTKHTATFPFFSVGRGLKFPIESRYVYTDDNIGLFTIPANINLIMVLLYPLGNKKSVYEHSVIAGGFFGIILTAFVDFCLGGVIFRYTGDISFTGAFLATVIAIEIVSSLRSSKKNIVTLSAAVEAGFIVVFSVSIILSILHALTVDGNLSAMDTELYEAFKKLFCVWL